MSLQEIKDQLPEYARDLKLNLSSVMAPEGAPGLTQSQIDGIALAAALAARNPWLVARLSAALPSSDPALITAAKTAAAIMAMTNIYYRSLHLLIEKAYMGKPARLRMNALANPGVSKVDFELYCFAVSAINGCGACLDAHEKELRKQDVDREGIQSALRIAAVIHAVAVILETEQAKHEVAA